MNTTMENYVNSQNSKLWTITQGAGIPVILCSGGPGCCDYLEPIAAMLEPIAKVIRYDPRGCGRSDLASEYSVSTTMADLESIRQHYALDQWIVIGHSWGADLALVYALEFPERCLGIVCISGGRVHNDREWHRVYSEGRDAGLEPPLEYEYPPNMDVNKQVNASWKQYIQRPTLLKEIAGLSIPAQFIYGEDDIRPYWPVKQVATLLPHADFTLLAEANHNVWLSQVEELTKHLQSFVSSLEVSS